MNLVAAKLLDWTVIRFAYLFMAKQSALDHHAHEAGELLSRPDFFNSFPESPAELQFVSGNNFQFYSRIATPWKENDLVRGRLFYGPRPWQLQPTVILLHGWNDEFGYLYRFPYLVRQLARAGLNTAMIELPYHLHRRPRAAQAVKDFISEDLLRTIEAARQSIADTRALIRWLIDQGCLQIGVWGFSLGAWIGGLIICHDPHPKFAVLSSPIARIDRAIQELAFCAPIRRCLTAQSLPLDGLNLISHRPLLSPSDILVVAANHDLFGPMKTIQELCEIWEEPEFWRLDHGHISALMSPFLLKKTIGWITSKVGQGSEIGTKGQ